MGKATGFMEIQRQDRSYRPVEERVTHFREFVVALSPGELSRLSLDFQRPSGEIPYGGFAQFMTNSWQM